MEKYFKAMNKEWSNRNVLISRKKEYRDDTCRFIRFIMLLKKD